MNGYDEHKADVVVRRIGDKYRVLKNRYGRPGQLVTQSKLNQWKKWNYKILIQNSN